MTRSKLLNALLISTTAITFSANADNAGQTNHLVGVPPVKLVQCDLNWNADGSGSTPKLVEGQKVEWLTGGSVETNWNADGSGSNNWSADGSGSVTVSLTQCRGMNGLVVSGR